MSDDEIADYQVGGGIPLRPKRKPAAPTPRKVRVVRPKRIKFGKNPEQHRAAVLTAIDQYTADHKRPAKKARKRPPRRRV